MLLNFELEILSTVNYGCCAILRKMFKIISVIIIRILVCLLHAKIAQLKFDNEMSSKMQLFDLCDPLKLNCLITNV